MQALQEVLAPKGLGGLSAVRNRGPIAVHDSRLAQVPDLISMAMSQRAPAGMTAAQGLGGAVKLAFQSLFTVSSHL